MALYLSVLVVVFVPVFHAGVSPPNGGAPRQEYVPVGGEVVPEHLQVLAQYPLTPSLALPAFGNYNSFEQKLDHFDSQNTQTFKQKYVQDDSHYKQGGPVFLSIGGESALGGGIHGIESWLAGIFGAKIVALEHRYYGSSHPFQDMSTQNLKWLSAQQAVEDLMAFREHINGQMDDKSAKWVVFGGSYSASLAAWIREAHPDAIQAAISSSAPLVALADFTDFDKAVGNALEKINCGNLVKEANSYLLQELVSNGEAIKAKFGASKLNDGDFSYLLADSVAWAVQYGQKELLCNPLEQNRGNKEGMISAFISHSKNNFFPTLETGNPLTYEAGYLSEDKVHNSKNARQWLYQQCTELGWFQTAPAEGAYRLPFVNVTYFQGLCKGAFGAELWPTTGLTALNDKFHGTGPQQSHVAYTFGEDDPWQPLGKVSSDEVNHMSMIIHCKGCSHCVDMQRSTFGEINQAQEKIKGFLTEWLK